MTTSTGKSPSTVIEAKSSELNQAALSYILGGLNTGNYVSVKSIGGGNVRISVRGVKLETARLIHRVTFALRREVTTSWMPLGLGLSEESRKRYHTKRIAKKAVSRKITTEKEIKKSLFTLVIAFQDMTTAPVVKTARGEQFWQFSVGEDIILTDIYKTPVKYLAGGIGEYIYL